MASARPNRRRTILILLVLTSITLITVDTRGGDSGVGGRVRNAVRDVFAPVQDGVDSLTQPIEDWGDGVTFEFDPPRKLVHEWRSAYDSELDAEDASRVTWEIDAQDNGLSLLTVVHDRLEASPKTAASVAGPGWMHVLSGLKTLLETGEPMLAEH